MTTNEELIWNDILNFQIDEPGTTFTFVKRLAKENGWNIRYAEKVLLEYKKFIFLCRINKVGSMTPSDPVDQAWHLHLTYTRSYWIELCQNILKIDIHHNPTKGGKSEEVKFGKFYDRTRDLYEEKFREKQPADIWHNNKERFSDINFKRINLSKFWVFRKPSFGSIFNSGFLVILSMFFIFGTSEETKNEPLDPTWDQIIIGGIIVFGVIVVGGLLMTMIFDKKDSKRRNNNRGGGKSSSSDSSSCSSIIVGCGSDSSSDSGCSSGCGGGGCGD